MALLLRVQLAPAVVSGLVLAVVSRARRSDAVPGAREDSGPVLVGFAGAVIVFVVLDLILAAFTERSAVPLSWWTGYLQVNFGGGAEAFGSMPVDRYVEHAGLALGTPLAVLGLGLALLGGRGAWWVALPAAAMILSHQVLSYRVWRFIHPALPMLLVAAALGGVEVARRVHSRSSPSRWALRGLVSATALWSVVTTWAGETIWSTTWLFNQGGAAAVEASRGLNAALLEASPTLSSGPTSPARVLQGVLPAPGAPGTAFLGRDLPLASPLGRTPARWDGQQTELWVVPDVAARGLIDAGWRPLAPSSDGRDAANIRVLMSPAVASSGVP